MWKENLPDNCPPTTAKETKANVYRILKDNTQTEEDFKPYARLYKDNPRYKRLCKAHAISFYDTIENAKSAWKEALKRGHTIGSFIGQYEIKEDDGKNEYNSRTGHYSTWFYATWNFQNFNPSIVTEINEN